jgi:two-component system sensor histidine kinase VicK
MKVHFFSRTDLDESSAFQSYYVLLNLKAAKRVGAICFILCVLARILFSLPGLPVETILHVRAYNTSNWISLAILPLFYALFYYLTINFKNTPAFLKLAQNIVVFFALLVLLATMRASFFSMYNPRNTMFMYLLGAIMVGVFFTFEFYETLLLAVITALCFIISIPFYQHTFTELLLNNLVSVILLTVFYCISRFLYSYRADNFMKIKAIEQKNSEIENASQMKNEILGIVAHDLRNPLTAIKFAATLMEMDGNTDKDTNEYLQLIKASCEKANSIINDLLEMAQNDLIDELELEKIELNVFLSEIIIEWQKSRDQPIDIIYNSTKMPVYISINKQKMHRVMDNLISNAIKFSGGVDRVEISLKELDNAVYIDVKDFGIGIPENLLPYIFDRFSKAGRNGTRGEQSVGLGLSIVNQIIKKHSGEIKVNSAVQKGTTFTIKLPLNAA